MPAVGGSEGGGRSGRRWLGRTVRGRTDCVLRLDPAWVRPPTTWLSTQLIVPGMAVQRIADIGVIPVTPDCWANSRRPMPVTTPPTTARRPFPRPAVRIARSAIRTPITMIPTDTRPAGVSSGDRPVTLTHPWTSQTSVDAVTSYSPDPNRA